MFLNIWNFLRGYVTIEVSGFSIERFINLAANRNIYIWDVCPVGSRVSMKMSIKGYKKLKGATKKTRCKMKIVNKSGLPFVMFKYRDRKIFAFGIIFFIVSLYILSSFVWVIEIRGNERIKKSAVLNYCNELGLKPGAFKKTLNLNEMTNSFMSEFSDLAWIALEVKGTKIKINIAETVTAPKIIDKTTPCDVIAAEDGLITDITVIAGTPLVTTGDIVKRGDVLISGMLTIKDGEEIKGYRYTHAQAAVYGKVFYELNLTENINYTVKKYTGEAKKHYTIDLMDTKINLFNTGISYKNYDKITSINPLSLGGDFALPVSISVTQYKEYAPVLMERSEEKAKVILNDKLTALINSRTEEDDAQLIDTDISYENKDGKVYLKAGITVEKRLDEQKGVHDNIIESELINEDDI